MDNSQFSKEAVKSMGKESPLSDFKKALGAAALTLSDNELKKLHYTFERFADVAFDRWLEKRNAGLLDIDKKL